MRRNTTAKTEPTKSRRATIEAQILAALEHDARLSFSELGQKVGLSKTPAWARVRDLEMRGIITGYYAEVSPIALGLDIHAFVQVAIRSTASAAFEAAVSAHPAVLECYTTAGQADYLLHVLVANVSALDSLLRNEVSRMPGVERISTTVGMKTIKRRGFVTDCVSRGAVREK